MPIKPVLLEVSVLEHFADTQKWESTRLAFLESPNQKHLENSQGRSHSITKGGYRLQNEHPPFSVYEKYQGKSLFCCYLQCNFQTIPKNLSFFLVYLRNKPFTVNVIRGLCPIEIPK